MLAEILAGIGGVLTFMAYVHPQDAVSNFCGWLRIFRIPIPLWMEAENTDKIIRLISVPLLIGGIGLYVIRQVSGISPKESKSFVNVNNRIFLNAKPLELMQIYRKYPTIQADRLAEMYIGKWIQASGNLFDASREYANKFSVTLFDHFSTESIFLDFEDKDSIERISVIPRGQHIEVVGKVREIRAYNLMLDECELKR